MMTPARHQSRAYAALAKLLLAGLVFSIVLTLPALRAAWAIECMACATYGSAHDNLRDYITDEHEVTRDWVTDEFVSHRSNFMIKFLFEQNIAPALMAMTEQLATTAMQQTVAVGMFLDAKQQMEVQRLFQMRTAEAHKDYHASSGMCVIGTNVRSLAATQRNAELVSYTLSQRQQDRLMLNKNSSATAGPTSDREARLEQFIDRYCNVQDSNQALKKLCGDGPGEKDHLNKDVDFTRMVLTPQTLNIDFSDEDITDDERDIFALSSNLFGHNVFEFVGETFLRTPGNQEYLLDLRSVAAKRSVAAHSFNSIVGMKAAGTSISADTGKYMNIIMQQLGLSKDDATALIGEQPSYHAQMEILTKRIYQQPAFYTDLYDKPANVDRKAASLQAIRLMQDMDTLKSRLRGEMLTSLLLEMAIDDHQRDVQNTKNEQTPGGGGQ